ncbi:hypothetical protein LB506_001531 [Fusarium annulatum]|nr:hypothetical protein LB506_001531 [Fusarium annulatum]
MSNLSRIGVDGCMGKEREFEMFVPEDSGDGSGSPQPTVNAEEIIMADDTVEYVDKNAFGDELDRMPNGYYRSPQFIGTLAAPLVFRLRLLSGHHSECNHSGSISVPLPPTNLCSAVGKTRMQQTKVLDWIGMSLFTLDAFSSSLAFLGATRHILGRVLRGFFLFCKTPGSVRCFLTTLGLSQYKGLPKLLAWSNNYVIPAATRSGLPTKSQPSLFEAINKGNCSDVPGISKTILDSFEVAVVKPTPAHYIMSSTPLYRFPVSCLSPLAWFPISKSS